MEEKFSEENLQGFKEWLRATGINPDIFNEEDYKRGFLTAAFIQFQAEVQRAIMMQQENEYQDNSFVNDVNEQKENNQKQSEINKDNVIQFPGTKEE